MVWHFRNLNIGSSQRECDVFAINFASEIMPTILYDPPMAQQKRQF